MKRIIWIAFFALLAEFSISCSARSEPEPSNADPIITFSLFQPGETVDFEFQSGGYQLSGVLDSPTKPAKGLILFLHGYGPSDVRGWNMYGDLRPRFNALGFATATWDKPGQGRSSGEFDINQSVYDSADEVLAAAAYLRRVGAPGSKNIGLWGISRAGWIAPIALSQDDDLNFWISVSGTSAEDNFSHLLLSNLPYEGGSPELAQKLRSEWRAGCEALRTGQSYDTYLEASSALRANDYIVQMRGEWPTQTQYETQQANCQNGQCPGVDTELCSYIFIEDFEVMLSQLDVDVLALFGELDLNIDWQKVRDLYANTIGLNSEASLTLKTFANADHNLHVSETGSLKEMTSGKTHQKIDGYYEAQTHWLSSKILGE